MNLYKLPLDPFDESDAEAGLVKQLALLDASTKQKFDQAERLIASRLQTATASLQQSSMAIRSMLSGQNPADRESASGVKLQRELEGLLNSINHLSRLANMIQTNFRAGRLACEQRTDNSIKTVVNAIEKHRSMVQDNAIAMTEAALTKARSPSPLTPTSRWVERRRR